MEKPVKCRNCPHREWHRPRCAAAGCTCENFEPHPWAEPPEDLTKPLRHNLGPNRIGYVVAGMPRGATRFAAVLFNGIGWSCGHEQYFNPYEIILHSTPKFFGDSSWLSVPYLDELDPSIPLVHWVRDPTKTCNSILGQELGGITSHMRRMPIAKDVPPLALYPKWLWSWTRDWEWPEGTGQKANIRRSVYFWVKWHEWIEKQEGKRPYMRVRVEDLRGSHGPEVLQLISEHVMAPNTGSLTREYLAEKLALVSTKTNRRGEPASLSPDMVLSDAATQLAKRYGYDV